MTAGNEPSWDEIREQASMWLVQLDSGTADREDFEAWRAADPRHAVAFAQAAHVLQQLDRVKPVYKLGGKPAMMPDRRKLLLAVCGTTAAAALGTGTWLIAGRGRAQASTKIGNRQSLALPGGIRADLNTDSEVQWQASDKTVDVWLRRGELALTSGQLPGRLFAAGTIVTLTEGRINARLRGDLLDLAVVSGQVTLHEKNAPSGKPAASLGASQAVLAGAGRQVVRPLNAADMRFLTAWPQDELAFEGQTLGTAVAEYNRYLVQKIVIADPSLSDIRIGGRFTAHDPKPFLDALHAGFGINAVADGAGTIALTR